jgi:mRNA-degrading endonuclease toxin of MazEF toxin-antitoxin module
VTTDIVSRGEIWSINLGSTWGHEQAGPRFGLVVSDNGLNHNRFGIVLVIPTTTKNLDKRHPFRIIIEPGESMLPEQCALMCEQLVRLDPEQRLFKKFGKLGPRTMTKVDQVLYRLLGLLEPD